MKDDFTPKATFHSQGNTAYSSIGAIEKLKTVEHERLSMRAT